MKLKTDEVYCLGRYRKKLEILKKKEIKTLLSGNRTTQRFDIVIEATGKEEGLKEALLRIQPRGKIVLKSTFRGGSRIDIFRLWWM